MARAKSGLLHPGGLLVVVAEMEDLLVRRELHQDLPHHQELRQQEDLDLRDPPPQEDLQHQDLPQEHHLLQEQLARTTTMLQHQHRDLLLSHQQHQKKQVTRAMLHRLPVPAAHVLTISARPVQASLFQTLAIRPRAQRPRRA